MPEISLILVLQKTTKTLNDMAKVQINSEKFTPFGVFFSIMQQLDTLLAQNVDSYVGCDAYCIVLKTLQEAIHRKHQILVLGPGGLIQ